MKPEYKPMKGIKIGRYDTTGGTEQAPPVGKFYAGWVEPEDKTWILFIGADGTPFFYGSRDPKTGACTEPPLVVRAAGHRLESAHHIGSEVRVSIVGRYQSHDYKSNTLTVSFDAGAAEVQYAFVAGLVSAVKFTDYGKVLYDIRVTFPDPSGRTPGGSTVLENVDSAFVHKLEDDGDSYVADEEPDEASPKSCRGFPVVRGEGFPSSSRHDAAGTDGESRVVPTPAFKTKADSGSTLVTGPEAREPAWHPRETQANFDLDKLAEIWPEKYGEMADALRDAVAEKTMETCSGLPDGS